MGSIKVALVSADPEIRLAAAAAFDAAPADWTMTLHESPPSRRGEEIIVFGPDVRPERGGIVFDPDRPAALIERIGAAARDASVRTIAITGSGGGTGATSVALHLAAVLAERAPTCVVDLHPTRGAAARVGIDETPALQSERGADILTAAVPTAGGFRLLAPSADLSVDTGRAIEKVGRCFERVVVDVPRDVLECVVEVTDAVVLILPPTLPAAARAKGLIERFPDARWAVVLNRLGPGGETTRFDIQRSLGRRIAIELPCSPGLRDAEDDLRLLTAPLSRWRFGVARLARVLERS